MDIQSRDLLLLLGAGQANPSILFFFQVTRLEQNACAANDPAANVCRRLASRRNFRFAMAKILPYEERAPRGMGRVI